MSKSKVKKAQFLHQKNREYRGLRSVQELKTIANRIERRVNKQSLKSENFDINEK